MQNVLLVEDNQQSLTNLKKAAQLARGGERHILTAPDLQQAIHMIETEEVDIVVTDLALHSKSSDTDGFDVLQAAKKKDPSIPVIVISNYFTKEKIDKALDLKAFAIIDRASDVYEPLAHLTLEIGKALRMRELESAALRPAIAG
jgi:DNA-binding NtrC family response regulator